jgi:hypothetical protein
VAETTVGRIARKVENILIKCDKFRLPSHRHLTSTGQELQVTVVDAGEVEIERPKKDSGDITVVSKNAIR